MPQGFPYDVPQVSNMLTGGKKKAGSAIRGWIRQGEITGKYQREKNAKIWLNAEGVAQAWALWARHQGLDITDVPAEVEDVIGDAPLDTDATATIAAPTDGTVVSFKVTPGTTLTIVVQAA